MTRLADYPITHRWPPRKPDAIQLYSLPTPNGVKAGIALEEMGLDYDAHRIDFAKNDQTTPEFLSFAQKDLDKWTQAVKSSGATAD